MKRRSGFSLAELLVVLMLVGLCAVVFTPGAAEMLSDARTAAGAREMAMRFQELRFKSVSRRRSHGLFFQQDARGWFWQAVRDGNGNGLRTAEVRSGVDPTLSGPRRLEDSVEGVTLGFPALRPIPGIPPRGGALSALGDPVKFGRSNLVSFSPLGSSSSGTLYITDRRATLFGVLLYGPTARVRVWRLDRGTRRWRL
jgi:prepilin-type N-terminal cleavage/methylation domain-containing protein